MRTDKWVIALDHLNMNANDFGPTCHSTYDDLTTSWRGSDSLPSESELEAAYAAGATTRAALAEILRLESLETPRRLAESVLSDEGKAWLTANRDKIVTERGKL